MAFVDRKMLGDPAKVRKREALQASAEIGTQTESEEEEEERVTIHGMVSRAFNSVLDATGKEECRVAFTKVKRPNSTCSRLKNVIF